MYVVVWCRAGTVFGHIMCGSVCLRVHHARWSDLLQVKNKMYLHSLLIIPLYLLHIKKSKAKVKDAKILELFLAITLPQIIIITILYSAFKSEDTEVHCLVRFTLSNSENVQILEPSMPAGPHTANFFVILHFLCRCVLTLNHPADIFLYLTGLAKMRILHSSSAACPSSNTASTCELRCRCGSLVKINVLT